MASQSRKSDEEHEVIHKEMVVSLSGVDRHLFGLYVVSRYLEEDSPFLKEVGSFARKC